MRNSLNDKLGALVLGASALFMNGGCASFDPTLPRDYVVSKDARMPEVKYYSRKSLEKLRNELESSPVSLEEDRFIQDYRRSAIDDQRGLIIRSIPKLEAPLAPPYDLVLDQEQLRSLYKGDTPTNVSDSALRMLYFIGKNKSEIQRQLNSILNPHVLY
jgi:hypothetical protein